MLRFVFGGMKCLLMGSAINKQKHVHNEVQWRDKGHLIFEDAPLICKLSTPKSPIEGKCI
jgi:hypothetical protein